jgi:hypothetical protein
MGWGPDTLRAGDNVTVTINPSRTADRATGWLIDLAVEGREVPSLTDEKRVGAIFSGESTQTDARASSVIGTWITVIDSGEPWKWIDDPSQLELTEAGRRAVAAYDPVATSSRAIGVTNGLPSSTEKQLVERFALNADGQSLLYSFELTDPVYCAAPLRGELRWLYRPNVSFELVPCDPDATRSFLDTDPLLDPPLPCVIVSGVQ